MFSYTVKIKFSLLLLSSLVLSLSSLVHAQIAIAPTMLFVHEEPGIGEIYLTNTSSVTQEISFDYQFGYPSSSSEGEIFMVYDDSARQQQMGLARFIRMYPSQVIIEPGQSQAVRVQIMPMPERADGVYWTRLLIASSSVTPDVQETDSEGISTNINYVLEQNIPIFYRKGVNNTGVSVKSTDILEEDDKLVVRAELERTGNSPYLGMMYVRIYGENGKQLAEKEAPAYFYFNDWRSYSFNRSELGSGPYRVEFEFETKRRALSSFDIVRADKQVHSINVLD